MMNLALTTKQELNELERLRDENARLLAALNDIANMVQPPDGYYAQERARKALNK